MKTNTIVAALAVSLIAGASLAQEEAAKEAAEEKDSKSVRSAATSFTTLPFCRYVEQPAEVKKPRGEWEPVVEGKFYPLGSSYRSHQGGKLVLAFSTDSTVTIEGESSFGTRAQAIGLASRTVVLAYGEVSLALADNLPEGAFFVAAPGFAVSNMVGESRFKYSLTPNGDSATVRCVTGSFSLSGRHFDIPAMRAADELVLTSEHDYLVTILEGTSGDYIVKLDQGVRAGVEVDEEGSVKNVVSKDVLDWHLTPKTKVVINRAVPAVGERMAVHTMAFDAVGELQSNRVFCEGRPEINSGELVVKESSGEELAKRAAEASDTTEEVAAEGTSTEAEGGESSGEASTNE